MIEHAAGRMAGIQYWVEAFLVFGTFVACISGEEKNSMKSIVDESKLESSAEVRAGCVAACCREQVEEVAKRIERAVDDARAAVSTKLEDGKVAAERLLTRGAYALEDGINETAHNIKRHPFRSLAIAFVAGAASGLLVTRFVKK